MSGDDQRLREVLGEATGCDTSKLGPDDDLVAALALDSLLALKAMAMVEKRFAVRIPDARLSSMRTMRTLQAAIDEYKEAQS